MKYTLFVILIQLFIQTGSAQHKLNEQLRRELDSIILMDQKYRKLLQLDLQTKGDSLAVFFEVKKENLTDYLWKMQNEIDSSNLNRVEQIIEEYGYPGLAIVGAPANEVAFYVIQHSKKIEKYLPVIKHAAEKSDLSFTLYAMMLDRYLMYKDQEQIYGTQGIGVEIPNPQTGKRELQLIIWPIKDPLRVNERRKEAGFTQSIEEYTKELWKTDYRIFSLEEVLRWQKGL